MQELVLVPPGRTLNGATAWEAERDAARQEFNALLAECGPLAFRAAHGVLRSAADAEDVAQEALLRAYQNFHRLREPARFRGWVVRIAFRLALDRWRSARRREVRETEWSRPELRPAPPNAEEIAAANEFRMRLQRAMDQLPQKFRLVLLLSALEEYSLEEISGMLGVPMGTVKSRLFFARKKLAEMLR
jgi:RNA polymerase sigma-70 factor, ECF subfamily